MLSGQLAALNEVMRKPGSETFGLLAKAYVASALIRGTYHELVVGRGAQLIRHPMRARLENRGTDFVANKMQAYFASALMASALTEHSARSRIKAWVRSVIQARKAVRKGELGLKYVTQGDFPISDDDALQRAVDDAIQLNVGSSVARFYRVLDAALQVGVTGAGFVLSRQPRRQSVSVGGWQVP